MEDGRGFLQFAGGAESGRFYQFVGGIEGGRALCRFACYIEEGTPVGSLVIRTETYPVGSLSMWQGMPLKLNSILNLLSGTLTFKLNI